MLNGTNVIPMASLEKMSAIGTLRMLGLLLMAKDLFDSSVELL